MNTPTFSADIHKGKVLISSLFLFALGLAAAYMAYRGPDPNSLKAMLRNPAIFYPMTVLGALLFLGLGLLGMAKLRGGSPLRAGPEGLDLSGDIKIRWNDIAGIERYTDFTTPSLNGYKVLLKDADRFLAAHRDHRLYKRMLSTHSTVSTPVVVYTNSLQMDHDRFQRVVGHYLATGAG
ncbi:hypothetical protein [Lysobacter sp. Root604]|uniref:hypothetical protein n=1 Tax=Lysobacter sp. Root604 TaxID=1736568 RepID=UPI0006FB87A2|nr:hypothetical protein [Lysobacter sp. Root604]KRA17384.1 hypothetical protein ASD69_11845 [Lysobacter sp. Root604]